MMKPEFRKRIQQSASAKDGRRAGFTMTEMIVAGVACFILANAAIFGFGPLREMARRQQCSDNLRQLSGALHSYNATFRMLPPAAYWEAGDLDLKTLLIPTNHKTDPPPVHVTHQNWVQLLLPALDAATLADSFDAHAPIVDNGNAQPRMTELSLMKCPSDPFSSPSNPYIFERADGGKASFARGNYAINGGSEFVPEEFGNLCNPAPPENRYVFSEENRAFQWWGNGITGINKCFSLDDIRNGLSTTVAIEEIRAGLASIDTRGAWALGQIGASITWGHGVVGDAGGPNITENDLGPDDIVKGKELYELLGRDFIDGERMQCCDHCNENFQATARSKHPGGVQVLMLDGAVHFVSNEVDAGLWHVMHSRETPSETFTETFGAELNGPHWTEAPKPEDSGAPHVTPHSAPSGGEPTKDVVNSLGMKFVRIPAGEFMMGLPDEDQHLPFPPDAVPHRVRITHDYYLGQFEATQKQYERVMGENPSWHVPTGGGKTLIKLSNTAQCPVENVSWYDAIDFCRRLGELPDEISAGRRYRLPTEAEWERACRAGLSGPISFNRVWDSTDKTGEIAGREKPPKDLVTVPVGSYEPNAFGLFDMCGNVYEWVSDFRATGYYARSRVDDPQGPSSGYMHVIRGWHWAATGPKCKVYVASDPWTGSRFIGFRVVCTPGSD